MKGKLFCLFLFAHCLRNTKHHLTAAKIWAVSHWKELSLAQQDTQPAMEDKTVVTAHHKSVQACWRCKSFSWSPWWQHLPEKNAIGSQKLQKSIKIHKSFIYWPLRLGGKYLAQFGFKRWFTKFLRPRLRNPINYWNLVWYWQQHHRCLHALS